MDAHLTMPRTDYPTISQVAGGVSRVSQKWYVGLIAVELIMASAAAFASDSIHPSPDKFKRLFAALTLIAIAVALIVQVLRLTRRVKFDQRWFEGRAVAESTKTLTWRYMMKVPPFDIDAHADEEFMKKLQKLLHSCTVFQLVPNRDLAITPRMKQVRGAAWEERRNLYVAARLDDQIRWYRDKAHGNALWAKGFLWASFTAQLVAAFIAGTILFRPDGSWNFVPFCTTLAASFVAWSQAKRFEDLETSYELARSELREIKDHRVGAATSEHAFVEGVINGEGAISREHTMWVAKSGSRVVWTMGLDVPADQVAQS